MKKAKQCKHKATGIRCRCNGDSQGHKKKSKKIDPAVDSKKAKKGKKGKMTYAKVHKKVFGK